MGQLVRSQDDQVMGGVCAGIAQWAGVDPTLVRVTFALVTLLSSAFPGVLVYCVLWMLMPEDD